MPTVIIKLEAGHLRVIENACKRIEKANKEAKALIKKMTALAKKLKG